MVGFVLDGAKEVEAMAKVCVGVQDADEQRPYYGTGICGVARSARKTGSIFGTFAGFTQYSIPT
jgi:hypothetical protein